MKIYLFLSVFILIATFCAVRGNTLEDGILDENYDPKEVEVWNGKLRGLESNSTNGRKYYSYFGIKYATAARFQHSVPTGKWEGVFSATQNCQPCPQPVGLSNTVVGQEDCLCINVFTPNPRPSKKLPCMVYVHGGGFTLGSIATLLPNIFMNQDIVLLFMSYRLGALGNLCTGDSASPGNYAIGDQVRALEWMKENVQHFGGNPEQITIFGLSSGAASVTYLMHSPPAEGLFQRVISESGSSIGTWAYDATPLNSTTKLAAQLNCTTNDHYQMVECLKGYSAADIVIAARKSKDGNNYLIPFVPCKDNKYVTEDPRTAFSKGLFHRVPLMIGTNSEDGSVEYSVYPQAFAVCDNTFFNQTLPLIIKNLTKFDEKNLGLITQIVKKVYFDGVDCSDRNTFLNRSLQMLTDLYFMAPSQLVALYVSKFVSTYVYLFAYRESFSRFNITGQIGVQHGDEALLMFFSPTLALSEEDEKIQNILMENWVSFATNSKPTEVWQATRNGTGCVDYLYIGNDEIKMKNGLRTENAFLWNEVLYYFNKFNLHYN